MSTKAQSIFLGGLVAGLLSTSYLGFINLLCCAGVIIGGVVAVWHYTGEHALTIPAGEGAAMGALAGVVGAVIGAALNYLVELVGLPGMQEISRSFQELATGGNMTAEQREQAEAMAERFRSPLFMFMSLLINVVVSSIFGAVGGAIGASVFKRGSAAAPEEGI